VPRGDAGKALSSSVRNQFSDRALREAIETMTAVLLDKAVAGGDISGPISIETVIALKQFGR